MPPKKENVRSVAKIKLKSVPFGQQSHWNSIRVIGVKQFSLLSVHCAKMVGELLAGRILELNSYSDEGKFAISDNFLTFTWPLECGKMWCFRLCPHEGCDVFPSNYRIACNSHIKEVIERIVELRTKHESDEDCSPQRVEQTCSTGKDVASGLFQNVVNIEDHMDFDFNEESSRNVVIEEGKSEMQEIIQLSSDEDQDAKENITTQKQKVGDGDSIPQVSVSPRVKRRKGNPRRAAFQFRGVADTD